MLHDLLQTLFATPPLLTACLWATLGNSAMFGLALGIGELLVRTHRHKRLVPPPPPSTRREFGLALGCVCLNSVVAYIGIVLWRTGIIHLRPAAHVTLGSILLDVLVLGMAMDCAMYGLHRLAHAPRLFPLIHWTHHRYVSPRPLTLFVLNPCEVLGFGALWLVVITAYHASAAGILLYLACNLLFGIVGHLGVEPAPRQWIKLPLLRYITTSTLHAEHHSTPAYNFGFYTLIWDRVFGTLAPEYVGDFERAQSAPSHAARV